MFVYYNLPCGLKVETHGEMSNIYLGVNHIGKFVNLYNMKQLDIFHPEIFDAKINSYKLDNYSYLNMCGMNFYLKVFKPLHNIECNKIEFYHFLKEFLEC